MGRCTVLFHRNINCVERVAGTGYLVIDLFSLICKPIYTVWHSVEEFVLLLLINNNQKLITINKYNLRCSLQIMSSI